MVEPMDPGEPFYLATVHRAENTDDPKRLARLLDRLARLSTPVVLAVHPRLERKASEIGFNLRCGALRPVAPLPYPAMISAILQSRGVVTDSGGLQKETFLLGKLCTTLRTETEWSETLLGGWNQLDPDAENLKVLMQRPLPESARLAPYGDGRAALARRRGDGARLAGPHGPAGSRGCEWAAVIAALGVSDVRGAGRPPHPEAVKLGRMPDLLRSRGPNVPLGLAVLNVVLVGAPRGWPM